MINQQPHHCSRSVHPLATLVPRPVGVHDGGDPALRDWRALLDDSHPHALLIGDPAMLASALEQLLPVIVGPVLHWYPRLVAEPVLPAGGTLVVHEVSTLDAAQQGRLFASLDHATHHVRVLSLSSLPLYPLVKSGDFLETLYYRLNLVCVELEPAIFQTLRSGRTDRTQ